MLDFKIINLENLEESLRNYGKHKPFDHCVIDNFFDIDFANKLEDEFPDYDDDSWYIYDNPLENKKALNNWNMFPQNTYLALLTLNSNKFISILKKSITKILFSDSGLHGGGWHIHGKGGNLNPHLDYSIHPKCGLQRKLNLIIYLSRNLNPSKHKGHLGFWSNDDIDKQPKDLVKEIAPIFNRAVLFDTTQNSWHGFSQPLNVQDGIYRKSLAIYYLTLPTAKQDNMRAIYAPRDNQKHNKKILEIIEKRKDVHGSSEVYKIK